MLKLSISRPELGEGLAKLVRPNTGILMLETPGSNSFEMCDVPLLAGIAHDKNADCVVMIDNTWATPLYFKPLDFGVDISIHALTKYPSGHSDLLMGGISATARCWDQLRNYTQAMGVCVSGDDAYQILRGLRSMGCAFKAPAKINVENHVSGCNSTNMYRGCFTLPCPSTQGHDIWKRDFSGASGLFTFVIKDRDREACGAFLNALRIHGLGYSWGWL